MADGLHVGGIHKSFGRVVVIDDATFAVAPGEIVCLTGDNGAGKTTLLRCLVGLSRYEGTASLDGIDLHRANVLARIGYVPQSPALVGTATVAETLEFFAALRAVEPDLSFLPHGFLPPLDERVAHLSGGQRQRVALAIGFLAQPRLLLLDEPNANLDDPGRLVTRGLIRASAERGACVVVVSPAAVDLAAIVDRVLVLRDGVVSPADDIYRALLEPHRRVEVPA